ncbi:MAG TPA: ABC transporter permease [Pseudonocardiaceae bacterium]|jgi:ABC-2 type transport system permease protein|nr:ABC transporter permease [Pseudonocardiaceae bacterium]
MSTATNIEVPGLPTVTANGPWTRAFGDLTAGFAARRLWSHVGWQDVKRRYSRSLIGPFWMTITMATTTVGLGALFGVLLHNKLSTFLPYIGTGMIVWGFIGGCLMDGPDCFTGSDEMIKTVPVPFTALVLRTVWRQLITFAHNMVIYVVFLVLFFSSLHQKNYTITGAPCVPGGVPCEPGLGWSALLAIPGFLMLVITMTAATLALGVVAARFRDIKPLIGAIVQLLFFFTPISWPLDTLVQSIGSSQWIIQVNPLFHFVQIVRQPLIGQRVDWWSWALAGAFTVLSWVFALYLMRRYRHRIAYWL